MDIAILCSVVDNYGDIGFVYRLARSLTQKHPELNLSLIVSNLVSFASMAPGIDSTKAIQQYNNWTVLDWNADAECREYYSHHSLKIILQCFQCERPEWLDNILFDKKRTEIAQLINIEYLTAEEWADDFHLLKSGTRSAFVKKVNFMPGFSEKTAGLLLDKPFITYLEDQKSALSRVPFLEKKENTFDVLLFSYPRDFTPVIKALVNFESYKKTHNPDFNIRIFAAAGISLESVKKALSDVNNDFQLICLPYLSQEQWDALLTLMDFNFIRGEDSFSRACLSGIPFIWHAYPQEEEYHLVKVKAFVDRLTYFMDRDTAQKSEEFYISYNTTEGKACCQEAQDILNTYQDITSSQQSISTLTYLLENYDSFATGFQLLAQKLRSLGCLSDHLMDYITSITNI